MTHPCRITTITTHLIIVEQIYLADGYGIVELTGVSVEVLILIVDL